MEYLEGQSFAALLSRKKRQVPLALQLHVFSRVLAGLHYAHELVDHAGTPLHIVHRDISPQNIFLCYGGPIKLVDFGIAKNAGAQVKTATGVFKGKLAYAAPEQIDGSSIDRRADIFSMGVLLWEALVGEKIGKNKNEAAMLKERVGGTYGSVRESAPNAPPKLVEICDRAMAPDPADRFPDALAMQAAIDAYVAESGVRVSDTDVGALVAAEFEEQRSTTRRLVQERLGKVSADSTGGLPVMLPMQPITGSSPAAELERVELPTQVATSLESPAPPPRPKASSGRMWGVLAVSVVVVASAAFAIKHFAGAPAAAPATSASQASVATPRASSSAIASAPVASASSTTGGAAGTVELSLRATPDTARFVLDEAVIEGNPASVRRARDGQGHLLKVTAAGYLSEERAVVLDRDVRIELALKPDPSKPATRGSGGVPRGDDGVLRGPTRAPKPIDTSDPWGGK
jgi:serine/threonine-protein kinase